MNTRNRLAFDNVGCSYVRLLFGILSPLVGVMVGGLITFLIARETLQDKSVMNAYSEFVSEAARMVRLAHEGSQTEHDLARLEAASGVLMLYGSDEAICWSFQIMSEVKEPGTKVDLFDDFLQMVVSMRAEVGIDLDESVVAKECRWSLM